MVEGVWLQEIITKVVLKPRERKLCIKAYITVIQLFQQYPKCNMKPQKYEITDFETITNNKQFYNLFTFQFSDPLPTKTF